MGDERVRVGYGFRRPDKEFDKLECDRLFIDTHGTKRIHRTEMLKLVRDRDCVVVLVASGDLGSGKERAALNVRIEQDYGGIIELPKDRGVAPARRRPGRPTRHTWTSEEKQAVCPLWTDPDYSQQYVIDRASEVIGKPVTRDMLNRACGPRYLKILK